MSHSKLHYIRWFEKLGIQDIPLVGGKNASLGEMYQELSSKGVRIPNGFALTADAYRAFLKKNELDVRFRDILSDLDPNNIENLQERGRQIRELILSSELPSDLQSEILTAYGELSREGKSLLDVAVRSSATAEDLPDASFAGQQETYLNVCGNVPILEASKHCFASLFTDRAISYRETRGFDHLKIALSVGIQKMVRSDLAVSGVMFSIDTESGFKDVVLINASYGLGENIVQGAVTPDEYLVFKQTLKKGFKPILRKKVGSKEVKLIYDLGGSKMVKNVPVSQTDRNRLCLTDEEILKLSRWACLIEEHYSEKRGCFSPMDMEWGKDGKSGELYILQARPETVQSQKEANEFVQYFLKKKTKVLVHGQSVGDKISSGKVRVIPSAVDLSLMRNGEILVTDKTDPDWEPAMKRASAIVTNRGGRTCHAAIVSRELGVPAIVGTGSGTEILKDGQMVTVSCAEGEVGNVYEGEAEYKVKKIQLDEFPRPKTKVMMNLADPTKALKMSAIPNDGVGLARIEFIINSTIPVHPMALQTYAELSDSLLKRKIDEVDPSYLNKTQLFVDKLAQGVGQIAAAFYPKDVIVRLSDFKSNEYANLIGGGLFEPKEENPMLGFRGASRYYHDAYRKGFALECQAMKKVRDEMGLNNLKIMVPFCRTVEEGRSVLEEMEKNGLKRGDHGLELYVMCEIPSNVILAEEFAEIFDGFSIGSNDLTQLTLGVDRDSEIVAHIFDERNLAVRRMIADVIRKAKLKKRKIGICGQAPSDYPEFAKFLVEEGIDSISLNPDTVLKTTLLISETEGALQK